ncbi:uncharacterized protein LOC129752733 [Uranotaenia lowii]|uniref:uncharacterized protein LOC129752733 n=1 Tax=Uranotaenia lowii TaxID=190385 RepID=UPI00247A298C|nr:uncharacterized protein LOC129752733 [Uranotaenia lowii]
MFNFILLLPAVLLPVVGSLPVEKTDGLYQESAKEEVLVQNSLEASGAKLQKHDFGAVDSELDDEHLEHYAYPKYKYEYGVKDSGTGDHKSQWETRDGDVVKGSYTLDEPDGTQRIVEYQADDKEGFKATVKIVGHPKPEVLKVPESRQVLKEFPTSLSIGAYSEFPSLQNSLNGFNGDFFFPGQSYSTLKRYDLGPINWLR